MSRNALRPLVLVAAAALSIASTGSNGERAGDDCIVFCDPDPEPPPCPPGETCSDDTPFGLVFYGPDFGDALFGLGKLKVTAVGGTQTIRVSSNGGPAVGAFDAVSTGPAFSITGVSSPYVDIAGEEAGSATLRIVEPGTDDLYDRITVESAPVAHVELLPAAEYVAADISAEGPFAVVAGSSARLVVALFDSAGRRLIDDSLEIAGDPELSPDAEQFDVIVAEPAAASSIDVSVTAAQRPFGFSIPVVDRVDSITRVDALFGTDELSSELVAGNSYRICFRATTSGATVLGARWSLAGSSNLELAADSFEQPSCATVTGLEPGDATITATAEGRTRAFSLSVITAARPRIETAPPAETLTLGDRASQTRR